MINENFKLQVISKIVNIEKEEIEMNNIALINKRKK